MNLESIVTYLTEKGCGFGGKTIFINEMPASCDNGVLLLDRGTPIDPYLEHYYTTEFRFVTRSTDYGIGYALAKKVSAALKASGGWTAADMLVRQCRPLNLPRPYRRSVGGYWEFEVEVDIVFVDTSV